MLTLALDTTTAAGSVALADGDRLVEVLAIDPSQPIATRVPGDLMALLGRHRVTLQAIDLFAVSTGPGSFTGLRIGIAAMQGLALANAKPLIGVSSFEALASLAWAAAGRERPDYVAVWIDAWRGEVYGAVYATSEDVAPRERVEPSVAPPERLLRAAMSSPVAEPLRRAASSELSDRASSNLATVVFIGDGAVKYRAQVPGRVIAPTPLVAGAVAQIAHTRAAAGDAPPPHAIRPLYVRRPDAELARERSSG
jgi:tRNA threonylcarbamoyladenosine biosynthesis protein TsaB